MKIGLFISENKNQINKQVSIPEIKKSFSQLDLVKSYPDFFEKSNWQKVLDQIYINKIEAVILAAHSPKFYESTLAGRFVINDLKKQGINSNKISFANIIEQVAWTHPNQKKYATQKAISLIQVALDQLNTRRQIKKWTVSPRRSVLIIGKTVSGIIAAERLLEIGFKVFLVDKEINRTDFKSEFSNLAPLVSYVQNHSDYFEHLDCQLVDVRGWCGDYSIEIDKEDIEHLRVGGVLIAMDDRDWISELRPILQIDVDHEGKIRSRNENFLPVQTFDDGITFIPHKDKELEVDEIITIVDSAVLSLHRFLDVDEILHEVKVSEVNEELCGGCGTCIKICSFQANSIDFDKGISEIDARRCKGCGRCVVACPIGARDLMTSPNIFMERAISTLANFGKKGEKKILALLCNGCGYPAADRAGEEILKKNTKAYPYNVLPLLVECGGRIDCQHVLKAFKSGFDGVVIARCYEGRCHNIVGNIDMDRRLNLLREVLRNLGFDSEQLRIINIAYNEGVQFAEKINKFVKDLEKMGVTQNA